MGASNGSGPWDSSAVRAARSSGGNFISGSVRTSAWTIGVLAADTAPPEMMLSNAVIMPDPIAMFVTRTVIFLPE